MNVSLGTNSQPDDAPSPAVRIAHCAPKSSALGAVSAAHPLATQAALDILRDGGSATDAAIAAQAVICVVMPHAAGLGGDVLALVHQRGNLTAVNGVGRSATLAPKEWLSDGGSSVTVPGIVPGWTTLHEHFGRLALSRVLQPAINIAASGYIVDDALFTATARHRKRLVRYGGESWSLLTCKRGDRWFQPELASFLTRIADHKPENPSDFYLSQASALISKAVGQHGGTLGDSDFRTHRTGISEPIHTSLGDQTLWVQPPSSQGVLLAMAVKWLHENPQAVEDNAQHVLAELTDAVFVFRDQCAKGAENFDQHLDVNLEKASNRGGARAYLHTAGVAVADGEGQVVSSLVSVFDDFGSAVFVPELGIVLNNRAAGFTGGDNAARPGAYPVHTLAPSMLTGPDGFVLGLATPGADGQIQTLLQVITRLISKSSDLAQAIAAPRWRGQNQKLLIESDHPDIAALEQRGHELSVLPAGDDLFGAIVAAGYDRGQAFAASDWRRGVVTGSAS